MNKKKIKKEYSKLLNNVATKDYYTKIDLSNRLNSYRCSKGHITITKDVDAGVTPFMHTCNKCNTPALSNFYQGVPKSAPHMGEWYRPTLEECLSMDDALLDHVLKGGLNYRKIK